MEEKGPQVVRLVVNNSEEYEPEKPKGGGGDGQQGEPIYCSDDFLAAKLSERLGPDWRSTPDGGWRFWDGKRWAEEKTLRVLALSRLSSREVSSGVSNNKLARDVSSRSRIYAAVTLAAADPKHITPMEAFDADPWLLNTPAGVVDLRDGRIRDHDPSLLLTRMTRAAAAGEAPRFMAFLEEATGGDKELQAFLRRVIGYCLTGSIDEHAIFFLYDNGLGGTGKSTFVTVVSEIMADYAAVAPMDMFTVATGERHPAELALLFNVRLVTASETEEGRRWDEAKLKAITGGEPITARFMRGNFFTFRPMFKLLMSGNHRPRMRSADRAMRRRFHMIPFLRRPAKPDLGLLDKLRGEYGAILKWAIGGELERRRIGLAPPPVVVAATDEYFEAENAMGQWMQERCSRAAEDATLTRDLYRDFQNWAKLAGEHCPSERAFAAKLEHQTGIERWRHPVTKRRGFRGIGLLAMPDQLPFGSAQPTSRVREGEQVSTYSEAGEWEVDEQENNDR